MNGLMVSDALVARVERLAQHRGIIAEELLLSLVEDAEDEDLADHAAADAAWAEQGDEPLHPIADVVRELMACPAAG